jgi:nucleoside-diphosphate-sugar epimerase
MSLYTDSAGMHSVPTDNLVSMKWDHLARVLVTGATGTLGYNIVRHLGAKFPDMRLDVLMRNLNYGLFADLPNVVPEQIDLLDTPRVLQATCGRTQ